MGDPVSQWRLMRLVRDLAASLHVRGVPLSFIVRQHRRIRRRRLEHLCDRQRALVDAQVVGQGIDVRTSLVAGLRLQEPSQFHGGGTLQGLDDLLFGLWAHGSNF